MAYKSKQVYFKSVYDWENEVTTGWIAELPHSCDGWIIGDRDAVKLMIHDLQRILNEWPDDAIADPYDYIHLK